MSVGEVVNMEVEYANELDSMNGVSDDELLARFIEAIRIQNEMKRIMGYPICKFDKALKKAYLEYPDGRIEYAKG